MTPRGIRNNNPGNIRHGDKWQGLSAAQTDSDFCQFKTPEHGIRAMARILMNYERRYGLDTVRKIIGRWAPATENNTEAYVEHVARVLGVGTDQIISVADVLPDLVRVIIRHENGQNPYTSVQIANGVAMARG